ncbi:MAG: DNA cytosine methyltransferase [Candidatus Acidiferrales bacterium]
MARSSKGLDVSPIYCTGSRNCLTPPRRTIIAPQMKKEVRAASGNGHGPQGNDLPERKPRLLDLFCCAGGAGVGYNRAGFEVVGVDNKPQPNYPFPFIRADALKLDAKFLASFDALHASPPCQSYSDLAKRNGNGHEWPRLIEPVRKMLIKTGLPYVIENVDGAPLLDPVVLCGTMFPNLRVLR